MTELSPNSTPFETAALPPPAAAERAGRWIAPSLLVMAVLGVAAFAAVGYVVVSERADRLAWEERRSVLVRQLDTLGQQVTTLDGQVTTLGDRRKSLADEVAGLEVRRGKEDSALKEASERLAGLRADETRMRERLDVGRTEAETLERRRQSLATDVAGLEKDRAALNEQLKQRDALSASVADLGRRQQDLQRQVTPLEQKVAALEQQRERTAADVEKNTTALAELRSRSSALAAEVEGRKVELDRIRRDIAEADAARKRLPDAQRDVQQAEARLAQLRDEQKALEPQLIARRGELQQVQERLVQLVAERRQAEALTADADKARLALTAVRADLDQNERDLRAATARRNAVEGEVHALEARKASLLTELEVLRQRHDAARLRSELQPEPRPTPGDAREDNR